MDLNDLRIAVTLLSFVVFIGIVRWALSRQNRAGFDEAANLPFAEDDAAGDKSAAGDAAFGMRPLAEHLQGEPS